MKDVSAVLGAAFSSNHQSLVVKPFDYFAHGMHGPSPLNGFYSCERCSRFPFDDYLGLSLVRYLKNCPAIENLHVRFGAGLILPFLTVRLSRHKFSPQTAPIVRADFEAQAQQAGDSGLKDPQQ